MNYPESKLILEKVKAAKKILINCHYSPDADSVSSALSFYSVLKEMKKDAVVYAPGKVPTNLSFLPGIKEIEVKDFEKIDYGAFDLFISLDSSTWVNIVGNDKFMQPNIDMVVVDHHKSNKGYGSINLIDGKCVSTCEMLYLLFEDWDLNINSELATTLLTGIIADSGAFRYPATTSKTLDIASKLMGSGADKDKIVFNLFQTTEFEVYKFWSLALEKMKKEDNFVWTAVSSDDYLKLGSPLKAKSSFASVFLQNVEDTDFGFILVEERPGLIDISFRSRTGIVDTSKIASEFGGGGHIWAAGARIEGESFKTAVDKVLEAAKRYAKKTD